MKKKYSILIIFIILILFNGSIIAEDKSGEIIINYYDDTAMTSPIKGSLWRIYKVASIDTIIENNQVVAYETLSIIDDLKVNEDTSAIEVLEAIGFEKIHESLINMNETESNNLIFYESYTDENGQIVFDNLDKGIYLGVEIKAAEYHMLSEPFLISIPNTNSEGKEVLMSYEVEPKAVLSGNLKVEKKLTGDDVEKDRKWNIKLSLSEGRYRYETSFNQRGFIESGDTVAIKGGEYIVVYDVLAGSEYEIKEIEANQDGYSTKYENHHGKIGFKFNTNVVITNSRNRIVDTGVIDGSSLINLLIPSSLVTIFIVIISMNKKRRER